MPFLPELRTRLTAFAASLRHRRQHGDQLEAEVCLDIVADAAATQQRAHDLAYSAQQADLEAGRRLAAAQDPASPGGSAITPAEAAPIARLIASSARADERVTQQLA